MSASVLGTSESIVGPVCKFDQTELISLSAWKSNTAKD